VPVSTVRGRFRRFAVNAEAIRVWFTVLAHDLDPMLAAVVPAATALGGAVEAIAVAASVVAAARSGQAVVRSRRRPAQDGCCPTRVGPGRRPFERSTCGLRV